MIDRVIDNTYRLIEEIGKGGFGAVYKAVRLGSEGMGPVAIKVLNKHPAMKQKDYGRFQREASLMSQLVHPGIVSVYELGETADVCSYIVMELVTGTNLAQYVRARGGNLSLPEILDILIQAADALEYVHGHQIEHRDIKPQNILICAGLSSFDSKIQVKLVDFGVARLSPHALGGEVVDIPEVVGTYAYMSPEATGLTGREIDQRSDIYSLGVVAFELLASSLPFSRSGAKEILRAHAEEDPPSISSRLGREVAPVLEGIVAKCLAKDPDQRYQSIFGLGYDLRKVREDLKAGRLRTFPLATKDIDLVARYRSIFIGRESVVSRVLQILGVDKARSRLTWTLLRGAVGSGKSRCLDEIRQNLESHDVRYLYLKFSESEKTLPFQALSLAVNDYLTQFERYQIGEYRTFLEDIIRKTGDVAIELARLIPALRPLLEDREWRDKLPAESELSRLQTPSNRLNQAFKELFESLVGGGSNQRLIFLLDDIHLIDSASISLLQFLTEQMNSSASFSFVLTMRTSLHQGNLMLEGLLRKLSGLRRRFHSLDLDNFTSQQVHEFFDRFGIHEKNQELVNFALEHTDASPLQLQLLLKQLVSQDVLVPWPDAGQLRSFAVRTEGLKSARVELFNVETLISGLATLDSRDLRILVIAAICQEACEFEFFKLDNEFSTVELQTRLHAMVRRGMLLESGADELPIQRRRFSVAHEKLRGAILSGVQRDERDKVHYLLVKRIKEVYRNPQREQLLLLAKHIDGAGDLFEPREATVGLLMAVRICVKSHEHNLARYYIEKAMARLKKIPGQSDRLLILKEIHELQYMIFAAQGNLVAASEVCRQLVQLTSSRRRRQKLQLYLAQLQLSLGRLNDAYGIAADVYLARTRKDNKLLRNLIGWLLFRAVGSRLFTAISRLSSWIPRKMARIEETDEYSHQCLTLMALAQFHGCETSIQGTLYAALRSHAWSVPMGKWVSFFWVLTAGLQLRRGLVKQAYQVIEQVEEYFQQEGNQEAMRWLTTLRGIWFDYPNGRIDRLLHVFRDGLSTSYPTSGLLHFETYGLRAWLRLIAPSSLPSRDTDPSRDRRKNSGSSLHRGASRAGQSITFFEQDTLIENNSARRVLDSGENGQYTALSLFADSLRFALADRVEQLKRSNEQMQRQRAMSHIGDAFGLFSAALLEILSGRSAEALRNYRRACRRIVRCRSEVISMPVADALRFALLFFPLWARTSGGQTSWPWDRDLLRILTRLDDRLAQMDGSRKMKPNAISLSYSATRAYLQGETRRALSLLDLAIRESRMQKTDLLEGFNLLILGVFSAERKIPRASEHFEAVIALASEMRWNSIERMVHNATRVYGIEIEFEDSLSEGEFTVSGRLGSTQATAHSLMKSLHLLMRAKSLEDLLKTTTELAARALSTKVALLYLRNQRTGEFKCQVAFGAEELSRLSLAPSDIIKWLPSQLTDHVKLVPLSDGFMPPRRTDPTSQEKSEGMLAVTVATQPDEHEEDATVHHTVQNEEPSLGRGIHLDRQSQFLTLIGIADYGELMGWIVLPDLSSQFHHIRDLEQELMLLGLHTGHLVRSHVQRTDEVGNQETLLPPQPAPLLESLPEHLFVESYSRGSSGGRIGWRTQVVSHRIVIACAWKLSASGSGAVRRTGDLLPRHLQLFAHSLEMQPHLINVFEIGVRLRSDLQAILEASSQAFQSVDVSFLVVDLHKRNSYEGVFGAELFTFSGDSSVSDEALNEVYGIIGGDQSLIFRHRSRSLRGHCGWAFGLDRKSWLSLYRFAEVDFLERYLPALKRKDGLLPENLGIESRESKLELHAIFVIDPDYNSVGSQVSDLSLSS